MSFITGLARAAGAASLFGGKSNQPTSLNLGEVWITDYRDLLRELRKVDAVYARQLKSKMKQYAKPMQQGVKKAIPRKPPTSGIHKLDAKKRVSGFKPIVVPGRLSWGSNTQSGNIPANNVVIEHTKQKTWRKVGRFGKLSLFRLSVDNPATVMADMAGRSRKWINKKPRTRPYQYSRGATQTGKYGTKAQIIVMRQHRINNQGKGMIEALNRGSGVRQGKASRWIWPTAEEYSLQTKLDIDALLTEANRHLNERLETR
jgi:hypothetical protein